MIADRCPATLSTIGAVMQATERMLGRYGFEHFSFSGVPYNGDSLPGVVIAHRIPAELFKLYVERRYADIDPSTRHLKRTTEPFKWRDVPYNSERDPRAAELMALVSDFGLSQVFCANPVSRRTFGNVWMAGPKTELTTRTKQRRPGRSRALGRGQIGVFIVAVTEKYAVAHLEALISLCGGLGGYS
jgi:LuxR family quorum sensing-dependent transcriptional regulator